MKTNKRQFRRWYLEKIKAKAYKLDFGRYDNKRKKRIWKKVIMNTLKLYGKDAYIAKLRAGECVEFKGKGNSMVPKIKSGSKCTYAPIPNQETLKKGDMVYCHVGKYYFTHLITAIKGAGKDKLFQISNNHGHVNGWIPIERIYGIVTHVEGVQVK